MPSFFDKNCITEFVDKSNAIDLMYLDFRFHINLLEEVAKIMPLRSNLMMGRKGSVLDSSEEDKFKLDVFRQKCY